MSFGQYNDNSFSSYHAGAPATATGNDFNRLTQVISNNVQKITQNVAEIQRMVTQIGTPQDNPQLRDRLHQVQHYTNQLAKDTNKYVKDLAHAPAAPTQSEQKQRRMHKERLMNEFSTALNNFQSTQRQAAQKEKASVMRARAASGLGDPFMDERRSDDMLTLDSPTQQTIQMEQDVDMELLREREQALHQLESDIMDVNQIFKDLGMLVHEQGEVIDSIEANVETAAVHVEDGRDQLQIAKSYQSKARRKKCICLILVVILLGVVALILGLTLNN